MKPDPNEKNYWTDLMGTDEGAATYMEAYGEGVGSETRHIIGAFINDGESVLDVGCGPGWNYDHFLKHGPKISKYKGLDYSMRFVRVASMRAKQPVFFLGDARSLKEPSESFDVVILQDVLEHTNGYTKPVTEALRVARRRVIISFWHLEDTDNEHINDDGNDGWGAWYDKNRWEEYLDTLGYFWTETETSPEANRQHKFYLIDKGETYE